MVGPNCAGWACLTRAFAGELHMASHLSRNDAVDEASERGVHAASPCHLPARRNANGKLYSVRTLKRRERRAPMLVLERPRRFASLSNCIVTAKGGISGQDGRDPGAQFALASGGVSLHSRLWQLRKMLK